MARYSKIVASMMGRLPMQSNEGWKVITIDNFARESYADRLIIQDVHSEGFAKFIAEQYQEKFGGEQAYDFYIHKPMSARLWRGMEDLI